jgi:hypothetical protein
MKLPDFVTGPSFWLLAVVIYRARPAETLNRVFALAAVFIVGYLWLPYVELFLYSAVLVLRHHELRSPQKMKMCYHLA